jgi:methylated-DNA-protein-cysteine methyltransferase-like protein
MSSTRRAAPRAFRAKPRHAQAAATAEAPKFARAVYALVREIPRGRVATYGQVAAILGHPRAARAVGTSLFHLPRSLARVVPWQRVINAGGRISIRGDLLRPDLQRELLESEGVVFRGARIDLRAYRWKGPRRERRVRLTVSVPFDGAGPAARSRWRGQKGAKRG